MEIPDTRYAKTTDGVYLAYQTLGEGPLDIVSQPDWPEIIDFDWDAPAGGAFLREQASFSRVIMHDQRGIGSPTGTSHWPTSNPSGGSPDCAGLGGHNT